MKRRKDEEASNMSGLAGDLQQLPERALADSESVQELLDEGNAFEASAVAGVENAKDPDQSEIVTKEVPEDDVPAEYLDDDRVS